MVAWNKKIRIIISVSILLFIATLFLETKTPFGVRAEYYQLFGGEFELQFNTWWNKLKTSSKSKLPDSKFELEYTAKEDGLNLDRIRGGNLENLKKIPHGVIWSGYMYVTNPKDPIININYSGRIIVLLDNKLTYLKIDEAKTEKLSFSLKKDFIPF